MNERKFWKALVSAFGGTGSTINEHDTRDSLVSAVEAFAASGGGIADKPQIAALVALTDSSGGTANNTVEVIPAATAATTDTSAASLTSTNASITAIKNDVADLTAKMNTVIAALKA